MVRRYVVARQKARQGYKWLVIDLHSKNRADKQLAIQCKSRAEARRRAAEMNLQFNLPPQELQHVNAVQ